MAGGANPHRRIERRALVGTAKATPKARTSTKRKVKSNTQSFLSANVCLDNADLFIHGQKLLPQRAQRGREGRKEDQTAPLPAVPAWASRQRHVRLRQSRGSSITDSDCNQGERNFF